MLTKRIIPCLDMKNGRVVKGIGFKNLQDAGDPAELAILYEDQGADELVLLDVAASREKRDTLIDVVRRTSYAVNIPFTVGGGIRTVKDVRKILLNGADKVTINTEAVLNPSLLAESAKSFGSQCIVSSIDVKRVYIPEEFEVNEKVILETKEARCWWDTYIYGGTKSAGMDALKWAEMVVKKGAGEIVASSLDFDGTKKGYDLEFLKELSERVSVPVIASSGAGNPKHMLDALTIGGADAALAASIFHYGNYTVKEVKEYLSENGVLVRL
jgi:cyclase